MKIRGLCLLILLSISSSVYCQGKIDTLKVVNPTNDSLIIKSDFSYNYYLQKGLALLQMDSLESGLKNLLNVIQLKYKNKHDDRIEQYAGMEYFNFIKAVEDSSTSRSDKKLIVELIHEIVNLSTLTQYQLKLDNIIKDEKDSELHTRLMLYTCIQREESQKALTYLDKLLKINPSNLAANALTLTILYNQGNWEECRHYCNKAIEIFPEYAYAYITRGVCNKKLGFNQLAKADIEKSLELYPNYPFALNELGVYYMMDNQMDKSIPIFKKTIEINPDFDWAYYNMGYAFLSMQEPDSTLKYYNKALEVNPNFIVVYSGRGDMYFEKKNFSKAIDDYSKCIALNPDNMYYYYNRSNSYYYNGNFDEAINDLKKIVEVDSKNLAVFEKFGDCFVAKKEYPKAIEYYTKIVETKKDYDLAYAKRAEAYLNMGESKKALKDCEKSIQLNPNNFYYYAIRGNTYTLKGNFTSAILDFKKSIQMNSQFGYSYQRLGDCYSFSKDYVNAIVYYGKAIELDSSYYALYARGMVYYEMKTYDSAISDFLQSIKISPDFAPSLGNLGWVYYLKDDFQNCIAYSKRAVKEDDDAFYAKFNIALATLRLGNFEEAKSLYNTYYLESKAKNQNVSGAINDLNDLIAKGIMTEQVKYIIENILKR